MTEAAPQHQDTVASPSAAADAALAQQLAPPQSERPGISGALAQVTTGTADAPAVPRLVYEGLLGQGSNGRVYAMHDTDLDRPVAVKVLMGSGDAEAVRRFVEGARITAALQHPNVLPVHELEITRDGMVFLTMKRIPGASLGDALAQATPERRPPPLDTPASLCAVFIAVAQALALAHQRSVIHQDIKPDNIMLGDFGEVLLADWGSAIRLDREAEPRRHLSGTPLYMSPEQAQQDHADARSDIYCLGASLFHCLTLRPPTWDPDPNRFLALKRAGTITPAQRHELLAGAQPLLAIALKALAPDPAARYPDATALLTDLQRYQGGLSVRAWREPWWSRFRRWRRQNARLWWTWMVGGAVVATLATLLGGEWYARIERWGPAQVEVLTAPGQAMRWLPAAGHFAVQGGRLVSTEEEDDRLLLDQRLQTPLAITYDAEELPGCEPGDISLIWARDRTLAPDGRTVTDLKEPYQLQVGAFDGAFTLISGPEGEPLACSPFRPGPGVHTIRVELQDRTATLAVDGIERCRWSDAFPFTSGYIVLRATHPGKAFGTVRIQRRQVPAQVPATAIGDAAARAGDDALAESAYAGVVEAHAGTALAREARWKEGLCIWHGGDAARAMAVWAPLRATALAPLVASYDAELILRTQGPGKAYPPIAALLAVVSDEAASTRASEVWRRAMEAALRQSPLDATLVTRYLALHDERLTAQPALDVTASRALLALGRYQEDINRYPYLRMDVVDALRGLDKPEVILREYQDQVNQAVVTGFQCGRYDIVDAHPQLMPNLLEETWWQRDQPERVLSLPSVDPGMKAHALYSMGRLQELLTPATWIGDRIRAAVALGDLARARRELQESHDDPYCQLVFALATGDTQTPIPSTAATWIEGWQRLGRTLPALWAGDPAPARSVLETLEVGGDMEPWTFALCVAAAVDTCSPQAPRLVPLARHVQSRHRWACQQRPWYDSSFLLGTVDEAAYLAQPYRNGTATRLRLLRGVRALAEGQAATAQAELAAYAAAPRWQQADHVDALCLQVVRWLTERAAAAAAATPR